MKRLLLPVAVALLLGPLTAASEARPTPAQDVADAAVAATVKQAFMWADDPDADATPDDLVATRSEFDPCDRGHRKAYCDFTVWFRDGDACDGTDTIYLSRRGRVIEEMELVDCDSYGDGN